MFGRSMPDKPFKLNRVGWEPMHLNRMQNCDMGFYSQIEEGAMQIEVGR